VSPAFFTIGSGGNLIITAGRRRFLLPYYAIQDILSYGKEVPLHILGGMIDAELKVTPHLQNHTVFFILQGQIYSTRWSDFSEVAQGIVQYAPLMFSPGGTNP
jgi:hypothetical protein